jgi:hypothetical protein
MKKRIRRRRTRLRIEITMLLEEYDLNKTRKI